MIIKAISHKLRVRLLFVICVFSVYCFINHKILLATINSARMTIGQTPILTILNIMSTIIKIRFNAFEIINDLSTDITFYYVIT